jgi:hypothetical protein
MTHTVDLPRSFAAVQHGQRAAAASCLIWDAPASGTSKDKYTSDDGLYEKSFQGKNCTGFLHRKSAKGSTA